VAQLVWITHLHAVSYVPFGAPFGLVTVTFCHGLRCRYVDCRLRLLRLRLHYHRLPARSHTLFVVTVVYHTIPQFLGFMVVLWLIVTFVAFTPLLLYPRLLHLRSFPVDLPLVPVAVYYVY